MNQAELHENYARCIRMCEGTEVNPLKCVRDGGLSNFTYFAEIFGCPPERVAFAIAIIENRPVFAGDVLFHADGRKFIANLDGRLWWEGHAHTPLTQKPTIYRADQGKSFSWNPKPKTFTLNGQQLLLPDGKPFSADTCLALANHRFFWKNAAARNVVEDAIIDLLSGNTK